MLRASFRHFVRMLCAASVMACASASMEPASAQLTWTGSGTDSLWSTAGNWSDAAAPGNNFNTALVFAGTNRLVNTNTLTGGTAIGLTFDATAGAFVIGGNTFGLTGALTNSSASLQTLAANLTLLGSSTIAGTGNTFFTGSLGNAASGSATLVIANSGTTTLSGANTFSGGLTVNAGVVSLGSAGALNATPGSENALRMAQGATAGMVALNGNTITIADLQGVGAAGAVPPVVRNGSATAATLTIGNGRNLTGSTFNGILQDGGGGSLGLTKTGTGTLTLAPQLVRSITPTNGSTWVVVSDTSYLQVGTAISGAGIPANATISALASGSVQISATATASATISGTFVQRLNTYSGTTTIANGRLNIGPNALPVTTPVVLGDAAANSGGVLFLQGSQGVSSLNSAGNAGAANKVLASSAYNLTITGTTATGRPVDSTFNGNIGEAGNAALTLILGGTGGYTVTLGGSNAYTGGTTLGPNATLQFTGVDALGPGTVRNAGTAGTYTLRFAAGASMARTTGVIDFTANTTPATTGAIALDGFNQTFATFRMGQKNTFTFSSSTNAPTFTVTGTSFIGSTNSSANTTTLAPAAGVSIVLNRIVPETPSGGSSRVNTLTLEGSTSGNQITGAIADVTVGSTTSSIAISKGNIGTWTLTGASSYTGATAINSGLLALGNGGSLGATPVTVGNSGIFGIRQNANGTTNTIGNAAFTLAAGSALDMADGFTTTLALGGNAALGPASGTRPVITLNLSGSASDLITIAGTATTGTGVTLAFAAPTTAVTPGNRTLITGGAGSTLATNVSLASGLLVGSQGLYALALTPSSGTAAVVSVADDPNALYWTGAGGSAWNSAGNWNTGISSGSASANAPGSTRNIAFATTSPAPGNLTTSLGANVTVNSVNFLAAAPAVTVAAGNTLTINGGGITMLSATAQTINAPITLGTNQVWSNQGTGLLTIAGAVTNTTRALTVTGSGNIAITGGIGSGTGTLTKAGPGTLTLGGLSTTAANNYSGTTFIDNGTVVIQGSSPSFTGGLTFGTNTPTTNVANNPTVGTLDLSNASATFGNTLLVRTTNPAANRILIGASQALTINGNLSIGTTAQTPFHTSRLDILGGGALVVNKSDGLIQVGNSSGANNSNISILDMSGLASFTANLGTTGTLGTASTFRIGDSGSGNPAQPTYAKLAATSTITAAFLGVGDNGGNAGPISLLLGSGSQTLNVNTIFLGLNNGSTNRASAALRFDTTSGSLRIRSAADPVNGAANLIMSQHASSTGGPTTSSFDVSNHTADIRLADLQMAGRNATAVQTHTDTFVFDTGSLAVANQAVVAVTTGSHTSSNVAVMTLGGGTVGGGTATFTAGLLLATNSGTAASGRTASATLTIQANIGSGFSVTSGTITMGSLAGSTHAANQANAAVNLLGGSLTMTGGIVAGGSGSGIASRVLTVGGGVLDMQGNAIGSAAGVITALFQSGTVQNIGELNDGGAFTKSGAGTLVVLGTNTFTGLTTIADGTLAVGNGGTSGNIPTAVLNDAALVFNRSDATTFAQAISGSGLVRLAGGSLTLSASNAYSGGTWIDAGTLTAGHVNAFGSGAITLGSGAMLDLGNLLVGNAITNNGGTIRGGTITGDVSGTTAISGGQTTFDSSILAGARLDIAATGTASFGNGALIQAGASIVNAGVVGVNRTTSDVMTIGGIVGGAGRFQLLGGVVRLDAANTYTGPTVISGSGSILALGPSGGFGGSSRIVVGDAGATDAILDLTAKSGSFALAANQALAGGGTILLASGGVFDVRGTFTPGNSPGLMTFSGGTTLLSGTTILEISGTNRATLASHGTDPFYDAVDVVGNGTLSLGGVLELDLAGSYADNTTFALFTPEQGSILTGNFADIVFSGSSSYAGLTFTSGPANPKLWTSSTTAGGQTFAFNADVGTLVIVPEPAAVVGAGIGIVLAGWALRPRRRPGSRGG